MPRMLPVIVPCLLFAAGAGAGWFFDREPARMTPALTMPPSAAQPKPEAAAPRDERTDFLQRLEAASTADFADLWEDVKKRKPLKPPFAIDNSVEEILLFARWAEADPQAAAAAAETAEKDNSVLLASVFRVWAERDPDAAVGAVLALKHKSHRLTAAQGIFDLAMDSPSELTMWMHRLRPLTGLEMPRDLFSQVVRGHSLAAAAAGDRTAFREMMAILPENFRRPFVLAEWCAEAAQDLPAALARIDSLKLDSSDGVKLMEMLRSLTASQPATLVAVAEKLPPGWIGGAGSPTSVLIALARAAPDKIHQITDTASSLASAASMAAQEAALQLFDSDPRLALKLSGGGDNLLAEVFGSSVPGMALRQPREALELLREAPPSSLRQSILMESLTRLRQESPDAARQWMESLPAGSLQDQARVLVEQPALSRTAAQFAMALANASTPEATASSKMEISSMLGRLMLTDPETTVSQISALPAGELRESSLRTAGQKWAGISTADAFAWSETLDASDKSAARAGIVREWSQYEPAAASEFVQALPPGPDKDGSAAALARGVSFTDPQSGLTWAASVRDPALRIPLLREVAGGWMKKSADAARQAVAELSGISEAERAAILNAPDK